MKSLKKSYLAIPTYLFSEGNKIIKNNNIKHLFFIIYFLFINIQTIAIQKRNSYFDQKNEFPNYFLPEQYRDVSSGKIPEKVVNNSRKHLNKALHSIFQRLEVPVFSLKDKELKVVKYFPYIKQHVPPSINVMPSGGVVRSALGYIYEQLKIAQEINASSDTLEILKEISLDQKSISAGKIRGIGSDFDVLISSPNEKDIQTSIRVIREITNSAEEAFKANDIKGDIKNNLFTIADVKVYEDQISRSVAQGGSSIDFLAFDLEKKKLIEPPSKKNIINDFLMGLYSYIPPALEKQEDFDKQVIRGIRPLIELPFIKLKDEGQLKKELYILIDNIKSDKTITRKAIEQIDKIVRNARFSGANNRIYRSKENSIEYIILKLNDLLNKYYDKNIPEFVYRYPLNLKSNSSNDLDDLLITRNEFIKNHTRDGIFYHGTSSIDNGFAILRGGIILSGGRNKQGAFVHGTGGYSSSRMDVAQSFAGKNGIVLELKLKDNSKVKILNLDKYGKDPKIFQLREKSRLEGIDFNLLLARDHQVDIIISSHILIMNSDAISLDDDISVILKGVYSNLHNKNISVENKWRSFQEYGRLHLYGISLGNKKLPAPISSTAYFLEIKKQLLREASEFAPFNLYQFPWNFNQNDDFNLFKKLYLDNLITKFQEEKNIYEKIELFELYKERYRFLSISSRKIENQVGYLNTKISNIIKSDLRKHIDHIKFLDLKSTNPEDVKTLKAVKHLDVMPNSYHQRLQGLKLKKLTVIINNKYGPDFPLGWDKSNMELNLSLMDARDKLYREYQRLLYFTKSPRSMINKIIEHYVEKDRKGWEKYFPEEAYEVNRSKEQVIKFRSDRTKVIVALADKYDDIKTSNIKKLLALIINNKVKVLTHQNEKLIDFFYSKYDWFPPGTLNNFLAASDPFSKYLLPKLKTVDILSILYSLNDDIKHVRSDALKLLDTNVSYRRRTRSLFIKDLINPFDEVELDDFPWNFNNVEDLSILEKLLKKENLSIISEEASEFLLSDLSLKYSINRNELESDLQMALIHYSDTDKKFSKNFPFTRREVYLYQKYNPKNIEVTSFLKMKNVNLENNLCLFEILNNQLDQIGGL